MVRRFPPPCGDNTGKYAAVDLQAGFPPPYGDNTNGNFGMMQIGQFPPPYGDNTHRWNLKIGATGFPPPYGDNTHYKNPVKIRVSIFYIPFFKLSCVGIFQQKITLSNTNTLCLGSLFHICILLPFFYKIKKLFVVQKQKNSCFCRCEPIYFPWLSTPFCVSSLAVTLVYHTKIRYKMNIFT